MEGRTSSMNIKPIIFSGPMVRAILREIEATGTGKTQTRRVVNPPPEWIASSGRWRWPIPKAKQRGCDAVVTASREWHEYLLPHQMPYKPGDLLWVRETWRTEGRVHDKAPSELDPHISWIHHEADDTLPAGWGRLRPSIHMPRWASRLTLRVESVRVERLQDISEEDAVAEGVFRQADTGLWSHDTSDHTGWVSSYASAAFDVLWCNIHGPDAWNKNPWVLALTFQPIAGNVDQIKEAS